MEACKGQLQNAAELTGTLRTFSAALKQERHGDLFSGPMNKKHLFLSSWPPSLPRKAFRRGGLGAPSLRAMLLHSDTTCHLRKERKIKQEDGVGAVTSTVLFLLNSVTLGQVKAGTSSPIPLVLTYLSAHCSVCVDDLDSAVLAGIFRRGWGENSQIYTLALWFPNFFSFQDS